MSTVVTAPSAEELFAAYQERTLNLARRMSRRYPPSVQVQEIDCAALEGLWRATHAYHQQSGRFWTFLRRLTARKARPARLPQTHSLARQAVLEDCTEQEVVSDSRSLLATVESSDEVAVYLRRLCPRDRDVVRLYYLEDLTMDQVGRRLGLSESRISQILTDLAREHGGRKGAS